MPPEASCDFRIFVSFSRKSWTCTISPKKSARKAQERKKKAFAFYYVPHHVGLTPLPPSFLVCTARIVLCVVYNECFFFLLDRSHVCFRFFFRELFFCVFFAYERRVEKKVERNFNFAFFLSRNSPLLFHTHPIRLPQGFFFTLPRICSFFP